MSNVLIAGAGYVGTALGLRLCEHGHRVWGACRSPSLLPAPIVGVALDLLEPEAFSALPANIEYVIYTAAPDDATDSGYEATFVHGLRNLLESERIRTPALARVLFTSSTAVYAQSDGAWVDEESPTEPTHFTGRRLLEAEALLASSGVPSVSVRLSGIYGPGRTRLVQSVLDGTAAVDPDDHAHTNRIHRDDCAGVLAHLMTLPSPERVYVAADDEPATKRTILSWLAAELHRAPLPERRAAESARSTRRAATNKRCRNARLRASGYDFLYPTFREGYGACLRALAQQSGT